MVFRRLLSRLRHGRTPLHAAATRGAVDELKRCLERQPAPDLNALDRSNETPLDLAIAAGSLPCVAALLDAGASPQTRAASLGTPRDILDFLIQRGFTAGVSTDVPRPHGPLWRYSLVAHGFRDLPLLRTCLPTIPDLSAKDAEGQTILGSLIPEFVTSTPGSEIFPILRTALVEVLGAGAPITGDGVASPLWLYARRLCAYIQSGDSFAQRRTEREYLRPAVRFLGEHLGTITNGECRKPEASHAMFAAIADPMNEAHYVYTSAIPKGITAWARFANALVALGFDANWRNSREGNTILHYLTQWGQIDTPIENLAQLPALVNVQNAHGQTPLHLAATNPNTFHLETLLRAGADPHQKDAQGQTAFDVAISAQALLRSGFDPTGRDPGRRSTYAHALDRAKRLHDGPSPKAVEELARYRDALIKRISEFGDRPEALDDVLVKRARMYGESDLQALSWVSGAVAGGSHGWRDCRHSVEW